MDYPDLLETVLRHLEGLGVAYTAVAGEPVTDEELASAEVEMKVRLPTELREFYQVIGDGFLLHWQSDPDDPKKPWGFLQVPELSSLASMYAGWRGQVLYSPERAEEYGFPYTKDPALAKRTAARMWHWVPLIEEGNGDSICLDFGDPWVPGHLRPARLDGRRSGRQRAPTRPELASVPNGLGQRVLPAARGPVLAGVLSARWRRGLGRRTLSQPLPCGRTRRGT